MPEWVRLAKSLWDEDFAAMSRMGSFSSPLLLGFDEIERLLDRVSKTADGYPHYNVERIAGDSGHAARLRITLAVAGFGRDEIEVTVEDNELTVSGRQKDEGQREYLHRGIAARQFQRTFVLADGMEVTGADLRNGLLSIDLVRPEPERTIRKVKIAYLRPVLSEEVHKLFPQAPELAPGMKLWALLTAAGHPIMVTDSKAAAIANAHENDLEAVSVH
jgi:HSP20 family molecular chaperone IbpA